MDTPIKKFHSAAAAGPAANADYQPLQRYLSGRFADTVVLSFSEIEDLLGHALPGPAYEESAWWEGGTPSDPPSPQSGAWIRADRAVAANLRSRTVEFTRV